MDLPPLPRLGHRRPVAPSLSARSSRRPCLRPTGPASLRCAGYRRSALSGPSCADAPAVIVQLPAGRSRHRGTGSIESRIGASRHPVRDPARLPPSRDELLGLQAPLGAASVSPTRRRQHTPTSTGTLPIRAPDGRDGGRSCRRRRGHDPRASRTYVGRAEEVRSVTLSGACGRWRSRRRRALRCWSPGSRRGLQMASSFAEHFLLDAHLLEHRLDAHQRRRSPPLKSVLACDEQLLLWSTSAIDADARAGPLRSVVLVRGHVRGRDRAPPAIRSRDRGPCRRWRSSSRCRRPWCRRR